MNFKEDQTAPFSTLQIQAIATSGSIDEIESTIKTILGLLGEKRDAYNGIVSSIVHIIDTEHHTFIEHLTNNLIQLIVSDPIRCAGKVFLTRTLFRLIQERPQFVADLFGEIIGWPGWQENDYHDSHVLKIKITALKAIRQAEQRARCKLTGLDEHDIDRICDEAMVKCDDATKVDTLFLVLDTIHSTKIVEERELELFKATFKEALSFQEPALRQVFSAITNKLIKRINDGHKTLTRDTLKSDESYKRSIATRYKQFLEWLITFCLDSIYCNAYFGSFILTITTLVRIIDHITLDNPELDVRQLFSQKRCYDSILSCLNDSFEENKTLALELLLKLPYNEQFMSEKNLDDLEKIAYRLVASVNPAHSLTCHYIFRLVIGLRYKKNLHTTGISSPTHNQLIHWHLSKLVELVELGVRETRENFVVALKDNAIYPKLTCIRALLNEVKIDDLNEHREDWERITKRIVYASIDACQAVSTIVCNLNPETIGHLPMDLKPLDIESLAKNLNVSLNISNDQVQTITSQMLLISGWKTIKECSLSLGALCIRFWWPKERITMKLEKFPGFDYPPLVGPEEIRKIIGFFDHYLRNLRHRGAFEQAYNGFVSVTKRIWYEPEFRDLLKSTLEEIMHDFKNENSETDSKKVEYLKAYVTRRSAGLPFIVQAIVMSEHKHESSTLRWVIESLFQVLDNPNTEIYQRIHCMNILRALIKEHYLAEKVIPFIGKTFSLCFDAFGSSSFPIRNCANMLLKAVVDRAFGVNRMKDDIHKRNKLSFEKFFSECPGLHEKMLSVLAQSVMNRTDPHAMPARQSLASVHAVFIVLSRLKSSLNPSDQFTSEKMITPFIDALEQFSLICIDLRLRELAAKLLVQLQLQCVPDTHKRGQQRSQFFELQIQLFDRNWREGFKYADGPILSELPYDMSGLHNHNNFLHGLLCVVKNWLEIDPQSLIELSGASLNTIIDWLKYLHAVPASECKTLLRTLVDILNPLHILFPTSSEVNSENFPIIDSSGDLMDDCRWFLGYPDQIHNLYGFDYDFKSSTLLSRIQLQKTDLEAGDRVGLLYRMLRIVFGRDYDASFQGALMRYIRQILSGFDSPDEFVDELFGELDLDLSANFFTPFDRIRQMQETEPLYEYWIAHCKNYTREFGQVIYQILRPSLFDEIIDMFKRYEFARPTSAKRYEHSARKSNTPRAIEFLATVYKFWPDLVELNRITLREYRTESFKSSELDSTVKPIWPYNHMLDFVDTLPDCDVRCFALLLGAKMTVIEQCPAESISYERFTQILDELSDADHSSILRKTCSEALGIILNKMIELRRDMSFRAAMVNSLSALIKLCHDEDREIRSRSHQLVIDILSHEKALNRDETNVSSVSVSGGRLDSLVTLITIRLFKPDDLQDISDCFGLLLRVIFNHSRYRSVDIHQEREQLFDKTKLNTFADHVATIQSVLKNFALLMSRREDRTPLDLNSLTLLQEIKLELTACSTVSHLEESATGDYSWRQKLASNNPSADTKLDEISDNNKLIDQVLDDIYEKLNYFATSYCNVLIDTEYTYQELLLYKKIAFVKFISDNTNYEPQDLTMMPKLQLKLKDLVENCCSTTILCKCLELIS